MYAVSATTNKTSYTGTTYHGIDKVRVRFHSHAVAFIHTILRNDFPHTVQYTVVRNAACVPFCVRVDCARVVYKIIACALLKCLYYIPLHLLYLYYS